jgi:hypothetical protein
MSRSLGLREDQQVGARLVARIVALFPSPPAYCRSERAREEPENTAGCQAPSVIVNVLREHARSYSGVKPEAGSRASTGAG